MIEDNSLTVLKAWHWPEEELAPLRSTAQKSCARRQRRSADSGPTQEGLQAKATDMAMIKGDVLFVPGSAAKSVAFRGAEAHCP